MGIIPTRCSLTWHRHFRDLIFIDKIFLTIIKPINYKYLSWEVFLFLFYHYDRFDQPF